MRVTFNPLKTNKRRNESGSWKSTYQWRAPGNLNVLYAVASVWASQLCWSSVFSALISTLSPLVLLKACSFARKSPDCSFNRKNSRTMYARKNLLEACDNFFAFNPTVFPTNGRVIAAGIMS